MDHSASRDRPILDGPLMFWPEPLQAIGKNRADSNHTGHTHSACLCTRTTLATHTRHTFVPESHKRAFSNGAFPRKRHVAPHQEMIEEAGFLAASCLKEPLSILSARRVSLCFLIPIHDREPWVQQELHLSVL